MGKASTNTTGTLAGQDAPLVSRRVLVKDRKIVVRNRRVITTDDADCCCNEEGCDPYPKCLTYEHGPAASGGGLKKCGLMIPSNGGPDRVRASCHIRGRRPDYNAGGAATDIVRYWLRSSTLPQITDWPRPMCPQWVASAADGCLVLTEFTEKSILTIVYRDGTTAGVDVIAHAFTDGKRWKVTCTPDGNGELYTEPNGVRTVTDTRVFTSLDFDGGSDGGFCEGTLAEVAHTSRLVISGIDPEAFTDDAKYWVVVAVPPDTALPSQPNATCRKPTSVECFGNPARSLPSVVKWTIAHTATLIEYIETKYPASGGGFYVGNRDTYNGTAVTTAFGRACHLGSCFGVLIPNSGCSLTIENGATQQTYRLDQTGHRIRLREDGSVIDDINLAGTSIGFVDPLSKCFNNILGYSLLEYFCNINTANALNQKPFPLGTVSKFINTGYFGPGVMPRLPNSASYDNPPNSPSGSYVGTWDFDSWNTTLGTSFIECRRTIRVTYGANPANSGTMSYVSSLRLTIEPDPLACPPAGGVVGIPPRDAALAMLDAYFRGK